MSFGLLGKSAVVQQYRCYLFTFSCDFLSVYKKNDVNYGQKMSVFGDFQQVWLQRFPESPLPGAWEEDVRANLAKHKQKVALLKEELEKEEFYVEYLERLLSDVEQHKKRLAKEKSIREESLEQGGDSDIIGAADIISKHDKVTQAAATAPLCEDQTNSESLSAHMCINEISKQLRKCRSSESDRSPPLEPDSTHQEHDASFVTVIEVNGLNKQGGSPVTKLPPKVPVRSVEYGTQRSNSDSVSSSSEILTNVDEPYYDIVASEDDYLTRSDHSSTENVFGSTSTLPLDAKRDSHEPQSPGTSNYVNIEYFIQSNKKNGNSHSSSEDEQEDIAELRRHTNDNSSYASSSSLESTTPSTRRKFSHEGDNESDRMYRSILCNIIDSETNYVEWLSVLLKYMKAIQATIGTSQPIVSETELNTIFYKIPELYNQHANFLESLKKHSQTWDTKIGDTFKMMASNLSLYGAFLSNYGQALDTVRKCSANNSQFAHITKNIICKHLSGQPISLEDLLHKPVARVQKNALVLHDLLRHVPPAHPDHAGLTEALKLTQNFLDQFNMIQTKSMFPTTDRAQRRLVKNSFIVEYVDGHRKLRHLFLFNDVIACAKYKSSGRSEKYTFELKWFIPVEDILILEETTANLHETSQSNIVALKSQASNVRDQLRQEEKVNEERHRPKLSRGSDKFRKRLIELESQLVLVSPNLVYRIKHKGTGRTYMFFLSSDFERTQWIEAIQTLQRTERTGKHPNPAASFSMFELQTWITACRQYLKTNMGSYLLRSGNDESLLVGDLHVHVYDLAGLECASDLYVCIEVDFYGHFFQKAKTRTARNTQTPHWNENFVIDLEGCENVRVLVYREEAKQQDTLFGKYTQKLSRKWLNEQQIIERQLSVNGCVLRMGLRYVPCEVSLRRVPAGKVGSLFGEKIQVVCKRQKRNIPFIVTACVREVERRGMSEVGVYRVSGSASDISKLKKSFETNSYEAEQLLKEVDIHSVTGILKLYLRELPEALFTDQLYPELLEAFNQSNGNLIRRTELLRNCFAKLPQQNHDTIRCILDHLIRVHAYEEDNKMSLHNLATVFGPTLLRPAASKADGGPKQKDGQRQKESLATGTVDVMAQAGILYCYLQDLNASQNVGRR
ncbi:active breakpoint cluster region-related protein isoform X2 [Cylas formicarius]|uniref:active breakpoint cluster region-related protein isoform X2 n=1 Tax=Cylas formicarius TaxID=197179 RepID=UPI002958949E|nr:active breakpoint cluster region-related protein isoform X2 [Cylas formicarius]